MRSYKLDTDNYAESLQIVGYDGVVRVETWQHGERHLVEYYTKDRARDFGQMLLLAAEDAKGENE